MPAHLIRRQQEPLPLQLSAKLRINIQNPASLDAMAKQFPNQCNIHGASGAGGSGSSIRSTEMVFRRNRRARRQPPVPIINEEVKKEQSRAFEDRISAVPQKLFVSRKQIMFPKMCAEPGATHLPVGPRWIAFSEITHRRRLPPQIDIMMRHPPSRMVVRFRRLAAIALQSFNQGE